MGLCCDAEKDKQMDEYWKKEKEKQETPQKEEIIPYHSKYLLTKNEWAFYKKLKETADKYNLHILTKVRLADLVEVDKYMQEQAFKKYFSKIMSKHVDFVLCNPENLAVKFIVELEDSSHTNYANRAERDDFVDKVLNKCGYKIIHTYGNANLDEIFQNLKI